MMMMMMNDDCDILPNNQTTHMIMTYYLSLKDDNDGNCDTNIPETFLLQRMCVVLDVAVASMINS